MTLDKFLTKSKKLKARGLARFSEERKPFTIVEICLGIDRESNYNGRTQGAHNFEGGLVDDGSVTCQKCKGHNIFKGSYDYEFELVMYAECGGVDDESNYVVNTYQFQVCLDCLNYKERIK